MPFFRRRRVSLAKKPSRGLRVEPICKVLPIAPSTYRERLTQRRDPARQSARARRDQALKPEIARVFAENFALYGVRKVWRQMRREGFEVARCTVARLMGELGLQGVIRGKPVRTTISDKASPCSLDYVNRQFHAPRPTGCGCRISPTSPPGRGSSTWPRDKCSAFALVILPRFCGHPC